MLAFIGLLSDTLFISLFVAFMVYAYKAKKAKKKRDEEFEKFMRGE